ncbi:MAG: hypothetical protein VX498_03825, partial [Myxococcota bacterium]|nr:hypothetical protein [Myxococcota bacterium]
MKRTQFVLLALLTLLHIGANALWLSHDEGVQFTDAAYHYSQVIDMRHALQAGTEGLATLPENNEKQRYGSLWYAISALISLVTGPEANSVLIGVSVLLWPLLLWGAWRLGAQLAPPERREPAGLLSAALCGFIPGIFNYSRTVVLDLPLAIAVLWSLVLLLELQSSHRRAEDPSRLRWGLAAVVLVALSIKINAAAFLLGPALAVFHPGVQRLWQTNRRQLLQAGLIIGLVLGVLGLWLFTGSRGPALRQTLAGATWPGTFVAYLLEGRISTFPFRHYISSVWGLSWDMTYYTVLQSFTPLLAVPVLGSYLWFFGRRRGCKDEAARAQRKVMFGWFILPVLGLMLGLRGGIYDERYLIPLLPQAAALIAVTVVELGRARLRLGFGAALVAIFGLNFGIVSFNLFPNQRPALCFKLPGWTSTDRVNDGLWTCVAYSEYNFMDRPSHPSRTDWSLDAAEATLRPERDRLGRPLRAVFLDDLYEFFYRAFQRDLLREYLYRHEDMLLVTQCWDEEWAQAVWGSVDGLKTTIAQADVVLVREGLPFRSEEEFNRGHRCSMFDGEGFSSQGKVPLNDGTLLNIYFKR